MFFFLASTTFIFTLYNVIRTRGICYFGPNLQTDNEKMIWASNEISLSDWPSKMHDISYNRSQLREYWTICLKIVSRYIIGDKSDWGNVLLALVANMISTLLIFWLACLYLGELAAFLVAMLYATMLWPYYVSVYTGHILLSQALFLASLITLTIGLSDSSVLLLFASGFLIAASFFASSASRKYPMIFTLIVAVFLARENGYTTPNNQMGLYYGLTAAVFSFLSVVFGKQIFANKIISMLQINPKHQDKVTRVSVRIFILIPFGFFALLFTKQYMPETFLYLATLVAGIVTVMLHILMPPRTFFTNIKRYALWLSVSDWGTHFNAYPNPMATFGHPIEVKSFKGGGWIWLSRLFWRMMPEVYGLWILASIFLVAELVFGTFDTALHPAEVVIMFVISISPSVIHYATGGLRVGKAMLCVVLPMMVPISIAIDESHLFAQLTVLLIFIQALRTVYLLHTDIIPTRMAPTILRGKLHKLGVTKFFTYDTSFNSSFVSAMLYSFPGEFEVEFVASISQVKSGYLVVPQTSAKSVSMETQQEAIMHGDFTKDPRLNALIDSAEIAKIAVAKIPTMGSSKYFAQESEVTSYLDLILKRISKSDRFRGNAWILEIK